MTLIYKTQVEELERKILRRVILISALVILGYLLFDVFYLNKGYGIITSLVILGVYAIGYLLVKFNSNFYLVKRLVMSFFILSMISGFFALNGMNGIAALDFANMFALITLISSGKERRNYFIAYLLSIVGFCYVHGYHSEWIIDTRAEDTQWFNILEVMFRFMTAFNLGHAMKTEYDKELLQVQKMNFELKERNEEITTQNEEISQQREEILMINEQLEHLVELRTIKIKEQNERLLEYAFFNAHKVRGPLARILGLINVTKLIDTTKERKEPYILLIEESAVELDNVIKEINILLSEREKLLGNE